MNWTVRAEHKHAEDESPACSIANGREISAEGKTKRQPETKARLIALVLKGTQ